MSANPSEDVFERELEKQLKLLQECQETKGLLPDASDPHRQGCFGCADMEQCEIRQSYVKAVYRSMNKGEAGDFAF